MTPSRAEELLSFQLLLELFSETAEATLEPMWHRMDLLVVKRARLFLSGFTRIMYNLGTKRKTQMTIALRVTHMHSVMTLESLPK